MSSDPPFGRWWRCSSYEIREGYIRPAPGADLIAFTPWDEHWHRPEGRRSKSARGAQVSEPPYARLANLLEAMPTPTWQDEEVALDANQERALVEWCGRYGLLGLLPEMVESVEILTAPKPSEEAGAVDLLEINYRRYGDRWATWGQVHSIPKQLIASRSRCLVNRPWLEEQGLERPRFEPLSETWARYFPKVPDDQRETYEYPMPLGARFWQEYAEPVGEFIRVAKHLTDVATRLLSPNAADAPDLFGIALTQERAQRFLNRFLQSTVPFFYRDRRGRSQRTLRSPSLLGMLAMMVTEDLLGERRLYQCACGRWIASTYPDTKYCSQQHREKYRKRAQRERAKRVPARKKAARSPRGRSARQRSPKLSR